MNLRYSIILKDNQVEGEFPNDKPKLTDTIVNTILPKVSAENHRQTLTQKNVMICYVRNENVTIFCISNIDTPKRLCWNFIEEVEKEFQFLKRNSSTAKVEKMLETIFTKYNDPKNDNIEHLNEKIETVKLTMIDNIESIMEREIMLEEIENDTSLLLHEADQFRVGSKKLKNQTFGKLIFLLVILFFTILAIIIGIVFVACGFPSFSRCGGDLIKPLKLKDDRNIVLEAVNQNGQALSSASENCRKDKEIVLIAVSTYGRSLRFASMELKNDKQVVKSAVLNDSSALSYSRIKKNEKEDCEMIYSYLVFIQKKYENMKNFVQYLRRWRFKLQDIVDYEFVFFDKCNLFIMGNPKKIKFDHFKNDTQNIIWEKLDIENIPVEICQFKNLTNIQITNCNIRMIPMEISNLINLEKLNLSHNQIVEIPPNICNLKELNHLDLSHNQIRRLNESIFELTNLKELNFEDNLIREISTSILKLEKLSFLNISKNKIWKPIDDIQEYMYNVPIAHFDFEGDKSLINFKDVTELCNIRFF
eukprot:gene8651-598_t